jgi:hypothetical protein
MLHEGDTYFERCYGADYAYRVPRDRKEACWQSWIAHYTKHQPAHRVDYALARIEALQNGDPAPVLPGLPRANIDAGAMDASIAEELEAADAAARPPQGWLLSPVMTQGDGAVVPNGCANYCEGYASTCEARCAPENAPCQVGCKRERAICLGGCY